MDLDSEHAHLWKSLEYLVGCIVVVVRLIGTERGLWGALNGITVGLYNSGRSHNDEVTDEGVVYGTIFVIR